MALTMDWEEARDRLRKLREEQQRCSEEVIEIWDDILCDFSYKLGDELWLVYDQVCVAACDCGQLDLVRMCIEALKAQFPGSQRVRKLVGMQMEMLERYQNAEEIYRGIIEEDATNSLVRKRLIAVLKSQNKIPEAIKELNDYLKQFMSDYEAWLELTDLYIMEQDYAKAAFCMEELIMSNPHNHLYHQRFAEIKYTQGGQDNMELARSYYAQAVKLNSSNLRALFGLFLSASNIASRSNGKAKKDNMKYAAWAAEQISHRYKEAHGDSPDDSSSSKRKQKQQLDRVTCMLNLYQLSDNAPASKDSPSAKGTSGKRRARADTST